MSRPGRCSQADPLLHHAGPHLSEVGQAVHVSNTLRQFTLQCAHVPGTALGVLRALGCVPCNADGQPAPECTAGFSEVSSSRSPSPPLLVSCLLGLPAPLLVSCLLRLPAPLLVSCLLGLPAPRALGTLASSSSLASMAHASSAFMAHASSCLLYTSPSPRD